MQLNASGRRRAGDIAVAVSSTNQKRDVSRMLHLPRVQRHVVELSSTVRVAIFEKFNDAALEFDVHFDVSIA